jgi:hypothetical protein
MVELIIGMVILSIIGMALTRILITQARYFDHQKIANLARNVSRGPLNRMVSDLRMVEALGGVVEAQQNYVIVRVPYAMGVVCATTGGATHISLLPVDSAMYAAPGFSGYAWRSGQGTYRYVEAGPPTVSTGSLAVCDAAHIQTLTAANAKVIQITPQLTDTASVGTPVFLFRRIRYRFRGSDAIPGSQGLFRTTMQTGVAEELSAPYDGSAAFHFFIGSSTVATVNPPADLSTLRGVELLLNGMSERNASGTTQKYKAPFSTAVFFKNRLD